ncbi:hypothetical protein BLD44_028445 [Mastigocladus laminosus UU774]|nr:hypothetical protein BLD44_028445 [Mastigocladus laminosus UU774]
MTYPESIELQKLETRNIEYDQLMPVWQKIDDLRIGGHRIESKKERYIVRRPGESNALYSLRLAKFVHTPVFANAITKYTNKLTSAPLYVVPLLESDSDFWSTFRNSTNGKDRDEKKLLSKCFRDGIVYGRSWVFVDRRLTNYEVVMNRLQEEIALNGETPYANVVSPFNVINWSINDEDDVDWVIIRDVRSVSLPLEYKPKYRVTWRIIDDTYIAEYEADIDYDPQYSTIVRLNNPLVTNEQSQSRFLVSRKSLVEHGRGKCPVALLKMDDELWTGNAAYLKALQYLQIENAFTDTATIAGYIQRVFTPRQPVPDTDPDATFIDPDKDVEQLRTGNSEVLIGADFKFSEASGSSLQVISEHVLDKIEHQIKEIVSLGTASANGNQVAASGVSKAMDYSEYHDMMRKHGELMVAFYKKILTDVAIAAGRSVEFAVEGLNSFEINPLSELLTNSDFVSKIESRLTETTLKQWYLKVANAMLSDLDASTKAIIQTEFEQKDFADFLASPLLGLDASVASRNSTVFPPKSMENNGDNNRDTE